jgi:tetratricopeptide (TPR) repeat protein
MLKNIVAIGFFLLLGVPAVAAGSGSAGGSIPQSEARPNYNPQEEYKSGVEALKMQDWKSAVKHFKLVVAAAPKNADANNLLGYSYRRAGDRKAGLKYYQKALKINPNHLGANHYLGEYYLEVPDMVAAETQLATLTRLCATCVETAALKTSIDAVKAGQPYKAKMPVITY